MASSIMHTSFVPHQLQRRFGSRRQVIVACGPQRKELHIPWLRPPPQNIDSQLPSGPRPVGGWREERILEAYKQIFPPKPREELWKTAMCAGWPGEKEEYYRLSGWLDDAAGAETKEDGSSPGSSSPGSTAEVTCVMDTGVIVALLDPKDSFHRVCMELMAEIRQQQVKQVVPYCCIPEADFLLHEAIGKQASTKLLAYLRTCELYAFLHLEPRILQLIQQYKGFPLGMTDAAVMAVAEELGAGHLASLDHRHLCAVQAARSIQLLP